MSGARWMSVALVALCLAVSSVAANGFSTQYRGHVQHPTLPLHCLYEELDLAVPLHGYELPSGHNGYCVRVHCAEDYLLMIQHCDQQRYPAPGCQFSPSDFSLQYPDCCPQLVCS
ncbi:uncharacterized protein LOC108091200 [Drosophila ficusphila]|uniref:uncharacterized protein LOC108091200 n=1 Tax=Drosophila ficusphila TaxID=30025 RepID=UPI0007E68646|nr:uncharacterized protein LOC108091200 [Drosophila ficusphila]